MTTKTHRTQNGMTRRAILGSAISGLAALSASGAGAGPIDDIIGYPSRGKWDDEFDSGASRANEDVASANPTFNAGSVSNIEGLIAQYEHIVASGGWNQVGYSGHRPLKMGLRDPSVSALRRHLIISGDLPRNAGVSDSFDSYVDTAVRRFQLRHGIVADGVVGPYTLDTLNIGADVRLEQLRVNRDRLAAIPYDLGRRYVMVNIPAASIEAVENGVVDQRHTAIVGRIDRATPILTSKIFEVILNPYWTAPRSIILKDIMPLMRKDPTYLERSHIRLLDANGNEVSANDVDWNAEKAPNLLFRQDPGAINAMASAKINFHNEHAVYMHDTPQKQLFDRQKRFESSGCVRVQNIRDFAAWLLRETPGWDRRAIEATISSGMNTPVELAMEVPVYFEYVTAWSARDGVAQFRDDIYQMDGRNELGSQAAVDTDGIEDDMLPL